MAKNEKSEAVKQLLFTDLVKVLQTIEKLEEDLDSSSKVLKGIREMQALRRDIKEKILKYLFKELKTRQSGQYTNLWDLSHELSIMINNLGDYYKAMVFDQEGKDYIRGQCVQLLSDIKKKYFNENRPDPILFLLFDKEGS